MLNQHCDAFPFTHASDLYRIAALQGMSSTISGQNGDSLKFLLPQMFCSNKPPQMVSFQPYMPLQANTSMLNYPMFSAQQRQHMLAAEPKPSHSYIGLIAMAILSSTDKQLVLSDIYQWVVDHYVYFRTRGSGWKNSIRHNLSLNDCFIKSGRCPNGKGHYWTIHPANMEDFTKGDYRRRRAQQRVKRYVQQLSSSNVNYYSSSSDEEELMSPMSSCSATPDIQGHTAILEDLKSDNIGRKPAKRPFDIESLLRVDEPPVKKCRPSSLTFGLPTVPGATNHMLPTAPTAQYQHASLLM